MSLLLNRRGHAGPTRARFPGDIADFVRTVRMAAWDYCELGLRVLPLRPMSKQPRSEKWPKRATADRDQVDDLFPGDARYNLGIATGRGTIVLDVDPYHGGSDSLARLEAEHGVLPETAVARSGSGGLH